MRTLHQGNDNLVRYLHASMDLKRWLRTDDTPRWQRAATGFLVLATVAALVTLVWFLAR